MGTARAAREGCYNVRARPFIRRLPVGALTCAPGRHLQAMGGILVVLLILFGVSFTGSGQGAANDEWKPQSQLQMSQRQADLYDDLTFKARTRGRGGGDGLPPGAPAKAAGSARADRPAGSVASQAAYEDGDDEAAFLRMAKQQEMEIMANERSARRNGNRGPDSRGPGSNRAGAAQAAASSQPGTEQIQLFGQLYSPNRPAFTLFFSPEWNRDMAKICADVWNKC